MLGHSKLKPLPENLSGARTARFFTARFPFPKQRRSHRCRFSGRCSALVVCADKTFYQILDVPKDADTKAIKKAFKKMALKYHPDVNKESDAKDRFMACKTAYQTLADEAERRRYDRTLEGGGGFDWGSFSSGFSNSQTTGGQQKRKPKKDEEEFYGFSQFFDDLGRSASSGLAQFTNLFRDIEKEYQERQSKKTDEPRSLWQELYDIGEEFVDFLEQGVGSKDKAKAATESRERTSRESPESAAEQAQAKADKAAQDAKIKAENAKKEADDEIEDMLAELKRKSSKKN